MTNDSFVHTVKFPETSSVAVVNTVTLAATSVAPNLLVFLVRSCNCSTFSAIGSYRPLIIIYIL